MKWGVWTNGDEIFIVAKTSNTELTILEIHNFDGFEVHKALLGMCFTSIDGALGAPYIMDSICPPPARES